MRNAFKLAFAATFGVMAAFLVMGLVPAILGLIAGVSNALP